MSPTKKRELVVQGTAVRVTDRGGEDYISLTDMVKHVGDEQVLYAWMRNRNTVEFLGVWESLHNPAFNPVEFDRFRTEAGLNQFTLSPKKWVDATGATGIESRAGRYGGTFAHRDIALEFGSWLSPAFKLYLLKEFQRLKEDEARLSAEGWSLQRTLAKMNYRIHTDAIQQHLIPATLSANRIQYVYANEADRLNVALFGQTAAEWRSSNPDADGNIRDHATVAQLVVLANLESLNAMMIHEAVPSAERMRRLSKNAIVQMRSLVTNTTRKPAMLASETKKKP